MDRLDRIRIFHAVADRASFAEAARQLNISPVAASRAVAALEEELGVQLLRRTTRSVGLTEEGGDYLGRSRLALTELEDAARAVRGEDSRPRGLLVVTAPLIFGRMHVMPIVAGLLRDHPGLTVRLILIDRMVRLAEEGVDIAVRIAHLPDSALRAVPIAGARRVLVASPDYLARRGVPASASDVQRHDLIAFDTFTQNGEWRLGGIAVRVEPVLATNSVEGAIEAALRGLGITRVFSYQVAAHVAEGRLVRLLPDCEPENVPVSLVYQANRQRSANVKSFIAAARAALPGCPVL